MLDVIGAGLGRTGTLSLKLALEQLGLAKCYHMMEVFAQPSHIELWSRAATGKPDWASLFAGCRAAVDWPACHFWRELAQTYPTAKVILTARDPESWYKSFSNTILKALQAPLPPDPTFAAHMKMVREIVAHQFFGDRLDNEHILATYRRHLEEVKRSVPANRLLVYDVGQGWSPLCKFLGVPVPATDFPRTNTTEEFVARLAARG